MAISILLLVLNLGVGAGLFSGVIILMCTACLAVSITPLKCVRYEAVILVFVASLAMELFLF